MPVDRGLKNIDRDADSRMHWAHQEIVVVNVVDINFVVIVPAGRQWLGKAKPVTVILEAWMSSDDGRVPNSEPVIAAKMRPEMLFWNAVMCCSVRIVANVVPAVLRARIVVVPVITMMLVTMVMVIVVMLRRCRHSHSDCKCQNR